MKKRAALQDQKQNSALETVPPVSAWWNRDWLFGLVLLAGTLLVYLPAWNGQPVWDDENYLTPPGLQSIQGLVRIWIQPTTTAQYYPLTYTSFWIEHQLWGNAPLGYHLVNILLHTGVALLLLRILRRLEIPGAPLAAALFALHPLQVESVAWISELKNTLSGVFFLSAALTYFRFDKNRRRADYILALGLFMLALLSKTVVATLPAALLVVFWWKREKLQWKEDVLPLLPFFGLAAGFGMISAWMERKVVGAAGSEFNFSFVERGLIAGRALWFYLGKLAWPQHLIFIYPRWQISQYAWWQYLFPAAALGLVVGLWWRRKQSRGPLAAFLLFAGTLSPALGFLNVYPFRYSFVADHFQYLACIAPLSLAAAGATMLLGRIKQARVRHVLPLSGLLLLIALGAMSFQQAGMYSDIETLYKTTIARNPDCWMAYGNLGLFLIEKGQVEAGISDLEKAVEIKPDYADPYNNLGTVMQQEGRLDEAIFDYKKALALKPDLADAHFNLGVVLREKGQTDDAISQFKMAEEYKPDDAELHTELGLALEQEGEIPQAIVEFEAAIALKPDYVSAYDDLASALLESGHSLEAIRQFEKVLTMDSNNVDALNNLAWILATAPQTSLRDGPQAVELAKQAIRLTNGQNAVVLNTLTAAYAESGRFEEALATARNVLKYAEAHSNNTLADTLKKEIKLYETHQALRSNPKTQD